MDFLKNYQKAYFTEHLYVADFNLIKWMVI